MKINRFVFQKPINLISGEILEGFHLTYTTYGQLNDKKDNVIWVFHALTGNSNVHEWWANLFGDEQLLNPKQYFIICANTPGSCYGSISPLDVNPATGKPYFHAFPLITIKDMIAMYNLLRIQLGITSIKFAIGGSMGGMQAIEWASQMPNLFKNLILIATNIQQMPWAIAWNSIQRLAIETDETWHKNLNELSGINGLKAARAIAMISYRNYETYNYFQREENEKQKFNGFKAESYQYYQGEKLTLRFNAWSYYALTRSMDSHNISDAKSTAIEKLKLINSKTLVIGIESDILFPIEEQLIMANNIKNAKFSIIDSIYGHDGFLIETEQLNRKIKEFINRKITSKYTKKNERVEI